MSESPQDEQRLPMAKPEAIPVFSCVIYVSRTAGEVVARNGHWTDLCCRAANERDAIRQLVAEFKQRAAAAHEAGERLPFDDEPAEKRDDEVVRLAPVHL